MSIIRDRLAGLDVFVCISIFFSSVAFYAPLCVPGAVTVKQVLIVLAVTVEHTYMKY